MTRQALATVAGLSISAIIHIEAGRIPNPRLDTLRALAKALGCTLDDLAGGEEEPPPGKPRRRKKKGGGR
jgi:transcriptional regulator with XRE-family HTH domain